MAKRSQHGKCGGSRLSSGLTSAQWVRESLTSPVGTPHLTRPPLMLAGLAALMGAAGVMLGAAAEHASGGGLARAAALYLILHAVAGLAIAAHARVAGAAARGFIIVGFVMELGAALFAADLATRAFTGARLFPFAAPIGGSTMILSWIALAFTFAAAARR
jgi:uncharacterized membrane protein YgdD (TMEM256/DUF423 family)